MTKGVVLIVTTWILAILTIFAIGVGFRTGLDIKLAGYNLARLKALYIARAGIKRAILEKWKEYYEGKSLGVDAFSEPWSNNEEYFKDVKVGDGIFTLSYLPGELDRSSKEIILYGLEDEAGKISINNNNAMPVLKNLFLGFGIELKEVECIIASIEDWRDEDDIPTLTGDISGTENSYYESLEEPYITSGKDFKALEELLLVRGITKELFYGGDIDKDGEIGDNEKGLLPYITLYGDGRININTAKKELLDAVFGVGYPELASKIVNYRKGMDGKVGTDDDRWFVKGEVAIESSEGGLVELKDLNDESWYGNIFGIEEYEYKRIKELVGQNLLSSSSDYYKASVVASVKKVKKVITAIVKFNRSSLVIKESFAEEIPPPDIEYLYWHEER